MRLGIAQICQRSSSTVGGPFYISNYLWSMFKAAPHCDARVAILTDYANRMPISFPFRRHDFSAALRHRIDRAIQQNMEFLDKIEQRYHRIGQSQTGGAKERCVLQPDELPAEEHLADYMREPMYTWDFSGTFVMLLAAFCILIVCHTVWYCWTKYGGVHYHFSCDKIMMKWTYLE